MFLSEKFLCQVGPWQNFTPFDPILVTELAMCLCPLRINLASSEQSHLTKHPSMHCLYSPQVQLGTELFIIETFDSLPGTVDAVTA